jgi:hypothetical protein
LLLHELVGDKSMHVREQVAESNQTSEVDLKILAKDDTGNVRVSVACNRNTRPYLLEFIDRNRHTAKWERQTHSRFSIRSALASNANASSSLLEKIASDDTDAASIHSQGYLIRTGSWACVAGNPNAPHDVLQKLYRSDDVVTREHAGRNPSLAASALGTLSRDRVAEVRLAVAQNPSTPPSVLEQMAKDKDPAVRAAVAANPKVPEHVRLAWEQEEIAQQRRLENEALAILGVSTADHSSLPPSSLLYWITALTDFPGDTDKKSLTKAMKSKKWLVRLGVALHPDATGVMLKQLSEDADKDVAAAAAAGLAKRLPKLA